jgi:acyl-coenzyme A synthetase/AMP-(fatty) acid ligase
MPPFELEAPINPEVLDFLKVAFSSECPEGYGQTENCGTATRCMLGDHAPVSRLYRFALNLL